MDLRAADDSESRFAAYVEGLVSVIGHADRAGPLRDYCTGLMMPCERKSVEPMAAVTAPARTAAQHQSLLHFVGEAAWSDERVLAKVREMVLPAIERHGPIEAWIIDDTGFPKQGRHSVGVARQYCGQLGKQDNCQVAVSLSLANHHASLPVAYRLYLPQDWAEDRDASAQGGRARGDRLQDQAGDRARADALGLRGRPAARRGADGCRLWQRHRSARRHHGAGLDLCRRHSAEHHGVGARHGAAAAEEVVGPRTAAEAARAATPSISRSRSRSSRLACPSALGARSNGAKARPSGCPRALRACAFVSRIAIISSPNSRPEEWLLIEWPKGENEPTKYWLSTLAARHRLRAVWSTSPSCAGASSATIRSSSRRSGSATSKGAAGAASTTTPRCASQPTDS